MPKEIINPRHHGSPDSPSGFMEVGWTRDRGVEVATIQPGAQIAFMDPDTGKHLPMSTDRPGFWVDLDREGINRLIRALRKARDQAFGSDA